MKKAAFLFFRVEVRNAACAVQYLVVVQTMLVRCPKNLDFTMFQKVSLSNLIFWTPWLQAYDCRYIAVNDGVDSEKGCNEFIGIRNYFNDFFAADTSKKIRAVQRAKAERGERIGSKLPYGYMKSEDNRLVPDPDTAPVVKRIFDMYVNGVGTVRLQWLLKEIKLCRQAHMPTTNTAEKKRAWSWIIPICGVMLHLEECL